jgi:hypothetical protein
MVRPTLEVDLLRAQHADVLQEFVSGDDRIDQFVRGLFFLDPEDPFDKGAAPTSRLRVVVVEPDPELPRCYSKMWGACVVLERRFPGMTHSGFWEFRLLRLHRDGLNWSLPERLEVQGQLIALAKERLLVLNNPPTQVGSFYNPGPELLELLRTLEFFESDVDEGYWYWRLR